MHDIGWALACNARGGTLPPFNYGTVSITAALSGNLDIGPLATPLDAIAPSGTAMDGAPKDNATPGYVFANLRSPAALALLSGDNYGAAGPDATGIGHTVPVLSGVVIHSDTHAPLSFHAGHAGLRRWVIPAGTVPGAFVIPGRAHAGCHYKLANLTDADGRVIVAGTTGLTRATLGDSRVTPTATVGGFALKHDGRDGPLVVTRPWSSATVTLTATLTDQIRVNGVIALPTSPGAGRLYFVSGGLKVTNTDTGAGVFPTDVERHATWVLPAGTPAGTYAIPGRMGVLSGLISSEPNNFARLDVAPADASAVTFNFRD